MIRVCASGLHSLNITNFPTEGQNYRMQPTHDAYTYAQGNKVCIALMCSNFSGMLAVCKHALCNRLELVGVVNKHYLITEDDVERAETDLVITCHKVQS